MSLVRFIIEYYDSKINEIDVNCERIFAEEKQRLSESQIVDLEEMRENFIRKISQVKEGTLQKYEKNKDEYDRLIINQKKISLENLRALFGKNYCSILSADDLIRKFENKLGILIISEKSQFEIDNQINSIVPYSENVANFKIFFEAIKLNVVLMNIFKKPTPNILELNDLFEDWHKKYPDHIFEIDLYIIKELSEDKNIYAQVADDVENIQKVKLTNFLGHTELETIEFASLVYLDMSDADVELINENAFDCVTNLRRLKMATKRLKHLPLNIFKKLTNLNELEMSSYFQNRLPCEYFQTLQNLEILKISSCAKFVEINDANVFNALQNLKSLYIDQLKIQSKNFTFNNLKKLNQVCIEKLCACKCGDFKFKFVNVKKFKLNEVCNQCENASIEDKIVIFNSFFELEDSAELDEFSTENALLSFLNKNAIKFLFKIKKLSLSVNRSNFHDFASGSEIKLPVLSDVSNNLFYDKLDINDLRHLKNLKNLELDDGYLKISRFDENFLSSLKITYHFFPYFSKDFLFNLSNLNELDLSFAQHIADRLEFDETLFDTFFNLEKLTLKNFFYSIDSNSLHLFRNCAKLKYLKLNQNYLRVVKRTYFEKLTALEELILDGNEIKWIQPESFKCLNKLRVLNLSANCLYELASTTFIGLESLTELYLNLNWFSSIEKDTFKPLENLEILSYF